MGEWATWATRALATSLVVVVAGSAGGVARAASPGALADPATTVTLVGDPSPTNIAGPLAAAAPSGAAAPVGSPEAADAADDPLQIGDVGSPPVPEHWPLTPPPTTLPPVVVDPALLFPAATIPSDVAGAPHGVASASVVASALAAAPEPTGAAPASEPLAGEPAPVAAGAGRRATLPSTR